MNDFNCLELLVFLTSLTLTSAFLGDVFSFGERPVNQWVVYRTDRTLAAVKYAGGASGQLQDCHIYDLDKHETSAAALIMRLQQLNPNQPIINIKLNQTLAIINACRNLDMKRNPKLAALAFAESSGRSYATTQPSREMQVSNISEVFSLWRGIVPGTKWCGSGDDARDYTDLGSKSPIVDSCCRSHDLCPTRLRPFRMGYGLINLSVYTKSHCRCDDEFFRCLKLSQSQLGDLLGNLYFNIMKFGCIEDLPSNGRFCGSMSSHCMNGGSSPLTGFGGRSMQPTLKYQFKYDRNIHY